MDLQTLADKLDELSERVRRYMTASEDSPANSLFLSGIRSSLEEIVRHLRKGEDELERVMVMLSEMKAIMGETNTNMRALRNRIYCFAGEEVHRREEENLRRRATDKEAGDAPANNP